MNRTIRFNEGWEFAKSGLDAADWSGLDFAPVDIPHDWLIENSLDLYENSIGWYRKRFQSTAAEGRTLLRFDGVYMDSTLYVNGEWAGEWKYGYSSFEHDITSALAEGDNELVLKVVHQSPNSRWYSGAGIYRNVWLKTRGDNWIETDGVYLAVREDAEGWRIEIDTELKLQSEVRLTHTLRYRGEPVAEVSAAAASAADGGAEHVDRQTLRVKAPRLWSQEEPALYRMVTVLSFPDGREIETVTNPVGFRRIELDPAGGLRLNGVKRKLNGVCEHHDLGALGAAFNRKALERRFRLLKDMGVNAIRTSHNMPAKELMDLADETGFLIVSEAFDMWERPKTEFDYARFFPEWVASDVRSWVRRDRNHPSLLLWSIGNEIYDTHADERGQAVTRMLMELVQAHDPKGNARVTIGSNYMPWENAQKCADLVKVAGYNYADKYYYPHHEEHPDWIIYGSETASVVQSRGIYHFPFERSILADDDEQCSALGNSSTSWGAKSAEACILAERDTPFSLGQFIWTGFDYIGEPTPYHTKNSYFGQIDTATFPKDSYWIYRAEWTDAETRPMIHLFPYWDFNEGQLIDVRVASNGSKLELKWNGETIGTQEIDHEHGTQLVGWWKIPYRPGKLTAIAYDAEDRVIATEERESFGDAKRIRLRADKEQLTADGTDLIFVEISMEDEAGRPVENANNRVRVQVTGAGRLVGLDNGDSTDYDSYKGLSRRLFSGKLMAIIAAGLEPGAIELRVASAGMEEAVLGLQAVPGDEHASDGVSALTENREMPCVTGKSDEIPLRKIEIVSESGQMFDPSTREMTVVAKLHPADTSYTEVEWSAVDDAGIESNIAKVEADGLRVKVAALGDGKFRLRCTSKNGTEKIKLISQLEFEATGLGIAYLNPYGFISAGLYDYSKGEVGNGNERGVATSRDGETRVGFRQIDFGPYGSDSITLPIFTLSDEEYILQIWQGMPGEDGAELLADVVYQKPSRWNVYQEETYRLSKRLRGISSLCFVTRQKMHIKGFFFQAANRAFDRNAASDCDRIYGDTFSRSEEAVEGIGNNVSLVFEQMDFGGDGPTKLMVYGRSPIDKNTIHIRFESESGNNQQLIEFTRTDGYEERSFSLEPVAGVNQVTFIFLPGSNFDFGWFRFER
ncbi:glycoside hydrolase family 2 TIM barrel-domain containing protein [Gorillibacterium sp. sgz500922]|uniref:glycoside hydrolase family 2 TIM barrel-domain containing protein n=1 Tax=Gorillibacterium sp. sgz500922 TaxID=3446694 RepID=UPI003F67D2F8